MGVGRIEESLHTRIAEPKSIAGPNSPRRGIKDAKVMRGVSRCVKQEEGWTSPELELKSIRSRNSSVGRDGFDFSVELQQTLFSVYGGSSSNEAFGVDQVSKGFGMCNHLRSRAVSQECRGSGRVIQVGMGEDDPTHILRRELQLF